MIKLIIGLFAGMVLMGALFLGPLSQASASGQSEEDSRSGFPSDIAGAFRESSLLPLQEAENDIQDADNRRFYRQLVESYHLEATTPASSPEQFSLSELLPDIESINSSALSLPLKEAGKNIHDPELAWFYFDLLKRSGWMIEDD